MATIKLTDRSGNVIEFNNVAELREYQRTESFPVTRTAPVVKVRRKASRKRSRKLGPFPYIRIVEERPSAQAAWAEFGRAPARTLDRSLVETIARDKAIGRPRLGANSIHIIDHYRPGLMRARYVDRTTGRQVAVAS